MLDKITNFLVDKIKKEMPDVDDERAEVINYGLQIFLGEFPKIFLLFIIAYVLGIFKLTLLSFLILMPYRGMSGGLHAKTHIGCMIITTLLYCGTAFLAKYIVLSDLQRYILIISIGIFGLIMIKLYAPADTEAVPILSKKVRRQKQLLSFIFFIIGLVFAATLKNPIISNIIIFGYLIQTLMITRLAYKITNNKFGYEVYENTSN